MNEGELDEAYGSFCRMLTAQGESLALITLARFALLAMHEIGDPVRIRELIEAAKHIDRP
jgi:hypothetical protein